jgi:hypothetical protein
MSVVLMPTSMKARKIIEADQVPGVFNAECIRQLAKIANLPANADLTRFVHGVRCAALMFASDAREPTRNQVYDELKALWKAAHPSDPPLWEVLATALETLSDRTRQNLHYRGSLVDTAIPLPEAESLRDPERREVARETLLRLILQGAQAKGRSRGGGKRSKPRLKPILFAREKTPNPPRRDAEQKFVMRLQHAWLDATGEQAVQSARRREYVDRDRRDVLRDLGPFAQFVQECLRLVGAPEVDAVEAINGAGRFIKGLASSNP